jgi:HEPN domain-containing protein
MAPSFEELLAAVDGKIHVVDFSDDFERYRSGLLYYWNKAEPLHNAARVIWVDVLLHEVAIMLTGMSMELLLKGIHVAFDKEVPRHHKLDELCAGVGIALSNDDKVILKAISEHIIWAARYPAPTSARKMLEATEIFRKQRRKSGNAARHFIAVRDTSFENCERLWGAIATYYGRAQQARIESVELLFG